MSRGHTYEALELSIFKVLIAANGQVAGYWGGRRLGAISFLAEAGKAQRLKFDGTLATQNGRGLYPEAARQRLIQAFYDLRYFPSSLHLLAYRSGAWEVRLQGTQTTMGAAWISSYLFSFASKIPPELELHQNPRTASSREYETPAGQPPNKRAREESTR